MKQALIAFALTTGLVAASAAPVLAEDPPQRYQVELQIMENGADVIHARTYISETHVAALDLNADQDFLSFEANLYTAQGDGEGALIIDVNLMRNGEELAAPRMTFRPGGSARFEAGTEGEDMIRISISPAS
ncbi:MAG: hypothetical protein J0I52_09880 [Bordetella sp.]|nr:hypothetical protein [Bordetella sp.]